MSLPENPVQAPTQDGVLRGWWLIVLGGAVMAVASVALEDFLTLVSRPLSVDFGWSMVTVSLGSVILRSAAMLMGPAIGYFTDGVGPRRTVLIGLLVLSGGAVLLSLTANVLMYCLASLLIGVGAGLCGWIPLMTLLVRRFLRRLTVAVVAFEVVSSVGGFVLMPLASYVMVYLGWRQVPIFLAGLALLLAVPVSFLLRGRPEGMGDRAYGVLAAGSGRSGRYGVSGLRVRSYWLIVSGAGLSVMAEVAILVFMGPMMADRGFSLMYIGLASSVLSFSSIAFIVVGGVMASRVPKHILLGCFAGLQAVGTLGLVVFTHGPGGLYLFSALLGAGYGGMSPLIVPTFADYFGTASFGRILGVHFLVTRLLQLMGVPVVGIVFDTQGYAGLHLFLIGLALLSAVCFVLARPPGARDAVVREVGTG